jgi:hypothetical protein
MPDKPGSKIRVASLDEKRRRLSSRISKHLHCNGDKVTPQIEYYDDSVIKQMAKRLGVDHECVARHTPALNSAATWYRLMSQHASDLSPSKRARLLKSAETQAKWLRKGLLDVEKRARRLLRAYGIERTEEAADGPQLDALAVALEMVTQPDEVRAWLTTVAGMATAASEAVTLFDASVPSDDSDKAVRQAVRRSAGPNTSWAETAWLCRILAIYNSMTSRGRATSVYSSGDKCGEAHGPLIDFIQLASQPLGFTYDSDAWRARIRRV